MRNNVVFYGTILGFVMGACAYQIKFKNDTPFETRVTCDLIGKKNKSIKVAPYATGKVNTVGWLTREVTVDVINQKTGQKYEKMFSYKAPKGYGPFSNLDLVLLADPILKNNKVDSVNLFLTGNQGSNAPVRYISGKASLPLSK